MTFEQRFERDLPLILDDIAMGTYPDYIDGVLATTAIRRQRPRWTFPERWLPMELVTTRVPATRLPMRQLGVLALIAILMAAALAVFVGSQQQKLPAPFGPAGNGVIALAKDGDIVVADRPGGDLRPLVAGPEEDSDPQFSPDGTRLAFSRETELGSFLMVADADGANVLQLTREPMDHPRWSFAPDGRSLMTEANIDGEWRIFIRPVDPAAAPTVPDVPLLRSGMMRSWARPIFNPTNANEILVVAQLERDDPFGGGLYVYDLATGAIRTIVEPAEEQGLGNIAWLADGQYITYNGRIVAADGSGGRALDTLLADRLSPWSNDGTRIVIDVPQVDVPGDDSHQRSVVVRIDGEGEPVELACGIGMKIECAGSWIWSPDDSMLIGTISHETSSSYLQADPDTGQVVELDWVDVGTDWPGTPAWQRVTP